MIAITKIREWGRRHIEQPINGPEMLRAAAMLMFALSAVIAVVVVYGSKQDQKSQTSVANARADKLQEALDTSTGISNCRAQVNTAVTDATTTYLFALGGNATATSGLVLALAQRTSIPDALLMLQKAKVRLDTAGVVLDAARDARVRFEKSPRGGCTGESPAFSPSTTTPAAGPVTPTTGPSVVIKPRTKAAPSGTSSSSSSSSSTPTTPATPTTGKTQPPTTTTTTTPPATLCDLIPDPLTLPTSAPCL